ncbi:MAG: citramalate synthase [Sedimentisphaerales bacterium]|nr:citramalate synthase [Sedimentisphaerales bacterium]
MKKSTTKPSASKRSLLIYDTTLRDGAQAEGVSFSLEDKLLIAAKLDELGLDYIEGGYPLSNAKDEAFFREVRHLKLIRSRIAAFGMTRRKGRKAAEDDGLLALQQSQAPVVTLVGKAWDMQVKKVLAASGEENLRMVAESVAFCRQKGQEVIFDAEHFFDGYKANPVYALKVLAAAADAGAAILVLCDTNGGCLEPDIERIVSEVFQQTTVMLGIHCHNDAGLAVANSLAAVRGGARQIQGTMNGLGERAGNADLCAVLPNVILKMGYSCRAGRHLNKLTEASRYVYEIANLNLPLSQPYVGLSSFAHKGGMHVHAVGKTSASYEHIRPEAVGNCRRIIISELSGASNLLAKSEKLALVKDPALVRKILREVQDLENQGYQFETAEASFDLIVRRHLGHYRTFFTLDHYRTVILKNHQAEPVTEAIVKILVKDTMEHTVAEGDGPVNALDAALRKAVEPHFPAIRQVQLVDYRVRVVNARAATAAKVRVVIESRDKHRHWGTIGVSENIIDASWQALVDSIEYKLLSEEDGQVAS